MKQRITATLRALVAIALAAPGHAQFTDFCNGDGGDQLGCTDCPCGNNAPAGTIGGCINSVGGSARLIPLGLPSVGTPTLGFDVSGATPNVFGILIASPVQQPMNPANPCFGTASGVQSPFFFDGLRCLGPFQQFPAGSSNAAGDFVFPDSWGPGQAPVATGGNIAAYGGFVAGGTQHFQVLYRDDASQVCQTGINTTQGVSATFTL